MLSNKKGTHIGKVLSFVIFVIFIFYIYAIIQPAIKTDKNKQSLLDYLKIELNENLSTKIKVMTVSLDNSISGNCIELKDFINFTDNNITLLAKNITGKILGSSVSSDKKNLFIQRGVNEEFLKIYYSKDFPKLVQNSVTPCNTLIKDANYSIDSNIIRNKLLETKIKSLINEYETNYEKIKNNFNFPESNNFGFIFEYENKTILNTTQKRVQGDIYAEEYPIEYITENAEIEFGFLMIKIW